MFFFQLVFTTECSIDVSMDAATGFGDRQADLISSYYQRSAMAAWSIISNASSLVQLLGAGINATQFLLARTNLTAADRGRAQWVRDGHQLALEFLDYSQRNESMPPPLLLRLERYA
jgi:hypothetical protein